MGSWVVACDTVQGEEVLDRRGEVVGSIAHVVIDASHGAIAYAVLARGGVFGIGESLFAVPWSAFAFEAERDAFVLERLEPTGGFDHERWPAMADAGWARDAHRIYRVTPYWEDGRRPR